MSKIRICEQHEKRVPLLSTMMFPGAELWCPYCGFSCGIFGGGVSVEATPELESDKKMWIKKTDEYRHAMGVQICYATTWEGKKIDPKDLPQKEKDRLAKIIVEWRYEGEGVE